MERGWVYTNNKEEHNSHLFSEFRHAGTRPRTRRSPSMRSATFAHEINVSTTLQHVTHQYHHSGAMPPSGWRPSGLPTEFGFWKFWCSLLEQARGTAPSRGRNVCDCEYEAYHQFLVGGQYAPRHEQHGRHRPSQVLVPLDLEVRRALLDILNPG
jgi:hypothetical protein